MNNTLAFFLGMTAASRFLLTSLSPLTSRRLALSLRSPASPLLLAAVLSLSSPLMASAAVSHSRVITVNGAALYTETLGHGSPIVFLHGGLLFFDNNYRLQRDYFAADHTVIGIDQRGHGHSADTPGPLSYRQMSEDTAAVIEQLKLGPVDVVGHSDGGDIALLLARDHPELVRRVVISGANLRGSLPPEELERRRQWSPEQWALKVQATADSLPPFFRADYAKVSPDGADHWMTLVAKAYQMWIQPVVMEPADLKKITAPVLVMAGDHDFTSIEDTVEIYRGLARGQLFILPKTGHGTFLMRPELSNLAIREFLKQPLDEPAAH
jgi:pimeloyl-ACP methyl ester carboxylesterase